MLNDIQYDTFKKKMIGNPPISCIPDGSEQGVFILFSEESVIHILEKWDYSEDL